MRECTYWREQSPETKSKITSVRASHNWIAQYATRILCSERARAHATTPCIAAKLVGGGGGEGNVYTISKCGASACAPADLLLSVTSATALQLARRPCRPTALTRQESMLA
eukprot:6209939-Pleurochrysis_carterae.AAC.1